MLHKSLEPKLKVTGETTFELLLRHHGMHSNTSIVILTLIQFPARAEEIVDSGFGASSPTNG